MSYDLELYQPEFLHSALAADLGDWSDTDALPISTTDAIVAHLLSESYVEKFYPWLIGRCFAHPNDSLQIEAHLFPGNLTFSVSYGPHAAEATEIATSAATIYARLFRLAFCDPASGRVICGQEA